MGRWMDMASRWEEWEDGHIRDEGREYSHVIPLKHINTHHKPQYDKRLSTDIWIEFNSPLFGPCTGFVELVHGEDIVVSHHSVWKKLATIRASWFTKILTEPPSAFLEGE